MSLQNMPKLQSLSTISSKFLRSANSHNLSLTRLTSSSSTPTFDSVFLHSTRLSAQVSVAFLRLTATCPPSLHSELLSQVGISQCQVIHVSTDCLEIRYNINLFETLDEARTNLVDVIKKRLKELKADTPFWGLVYCQSKADVDLLATLIRCKLFHADQPEEERRVSFNNWVAGKAKFMVCSSLLGCSVDVAGVCAVFHFGTLWSILNFVQESRRARQGSLLSISVVFATKDKKELDREEDLYGKQTM